MIGSIEGTVELKTKKYVIINVGGVGYKIFVSPETSSKISPVGSKSKLFTALEVREDAEELYGFSTLDALEFYETLRMVSGIGPKTALGILSLAPVKMLGSAIMSGDISFLTKVSGIGKKTAERIVVDLKDKIADLGFQAVAVGKKDSDLLEALTKMGYGVKESAEALSSLKSDIKDEEARLKAALKILSQNR